MTRDTVGTIKKAFEGVPLPKTLRDIAPHDCPECNELAAAMLGSHYEKISTSVVDGLFSALPLFSPKGLHHYLPAWLLRALEDPGGDVLEFTIYHLTPSKKNMSESNNYFHERFSLFNVAQRSAIHDFFLDVEDYQLWIGYEGEIERGKALWSPEGGIEKVSLIITPPQ
jgi:hypothetical protein